MFYTYIIQSEKDNSFYIGYSADPQNRLKKHNNANSGYTSRKQPWKLVYTVAFESKSEAIQREKFLKRQRNTQFYTFLISQASKSAV